MSVARPRNRLVYFRVSEDEFQKLASLCQGPEGARSISDVARSAVTRMLAERNGTQASAFDEKIDSLNVQIRQLTELLASSTLLMGHNGNGKQHEQPASADAMATQAGG